MPDRSPLMSAAKTGTPARANPSAITCNETVLPVPVAPVTRPWRLPSASVSQAGCSPLPTKIFSAVSAILSSEALIADLLASPLDIDQGSDACDLSIPHPGNRTKPSAGTNVSLRPETACAMRHHGTKRASNLALLQHLP